VTVLEDIHTTLQARPTEIVPFTDAYSRLPTMKRAVVGGLVVTDMTHQPYLRLVDPTVAPYPQTHIARGWLKLCMTAGAGTGMAARRVPWQTWQLPDLRKRFPLYTVGHTAGQFALVDIDDAFFNLYRWLALDVDYRPDGPDTRIGIGRMRFVGHHDMLAAPKDVRRSTWGMTVKQSAPNEYRKGERYQLPGKAYNRYLSPGLHSLLSDILHAWAAEAITRFGAVRVHTDSAVIPYDQRDRFVAWCATDWGLPVHVAAEGTGEIAGLTWWQIGDRHTDTPRPARPEPHPLGVDLDPHVVTALKRCREWVVR